MIKSLLWMIASALCCTVAYQGCSSPRELGNQDVKELVTNPRQFTNREVAVAGTVGNNFAVMGHGYFQLLGDDGSVLTVLSNKGMPIQGKKVTVQGKLHQAYSVGREHLLVLVEAANPKPEVKK